MPGVFDGKATAQLSRLFPPRLNVGGFFIAAALGIALLREWRKDSGVLQTPVIMISGHGTVETAVEAIRVGSYDFLEKPLSTAKLLVTVARALFH